MEPLLTAEELQLISEFNLAAKRRVAGLVMGEQRSPIHGGGIEFADYRPYMPGDDIRRIDWMVFLRLRRLMVRLCAEEKELTLMLVIDTSRSMGFGEPQKLRTALRMAAVLSGIALRGGNRVGILAMGSRLRIVLPPQESHASITQVCHGLSGIKADESCDPLGCMRQFAVRYGKRSMVIFLTDLLYEEWPETIQGLAVSGSEGHVIQMLSAEEMHPPFLGEVTLIDSEGYGEIPLHIGEAESEAYQRELTGFLKASRQACHGYGLGHVFMTSDMPLPQVFHTAMRREGVLC